MIKGLALFAIADVVLIDGFELVGLGDLLVLGAGSVTCGCDLVLVVAGKDDVRRLLGDIGIQSFPLSPLRCLHLSWLRLLRCQSLAKSD